MLYIHLRLGLPSGLFPSPLLPHSCHMSRPPHPPRLYNSNYTWRRVQIMKLLVMQLCPPSRQLIDPFRNEFVFYGGGLLAPRPTPKLEVHPLSSVRGCLFNIFAANLPNPPILHNYNYSWRRLQTMQLHVMYSEAHMKIS
jgi:hypothetical protein